MPPTPDPGATRDEERQAERLRTALDYLQARDLSGFEATPRRSMADEASDLADLLWRAARGDGYAPETLINACYRALENAQ